MIVDNIVPVSHDIYKIFVDSKQGLISAPKEIKRFIRKNKLKVIKEFSLDESVLHSTFGFEFPVTILINPEFDFISDIIRDYYLCQIGTGVYLYNTTSKRKIRLLDIVTGVDLEWNDTLICVVNGKNGIYSLEGEEIIPPLYEEVRWENSYYRVSQNDKTGYYSKSGDMIFPPIYPFAELIRGNSFRVQNVNKKWGVISKDGNIIANVIYDEIVPIGRNLFKIRINQKWGIIRNDGKLILDIQYEDIEDGNEKAVLVKNNNQWGLFIADNCKIIQPHYESIKPVPGYRYAYLQNGKWGAIDADGNELLPAKFDDITFSMGDKFNVIFDSKPGTIILSEMTFVPDSPKTPRFISGDTSRRSSKSALSKNKQNIYTTYDFSDN